MRLLWLFLFLPLLAFSEEKIERMDVLVKVDNSGDILVTERIKIFAEGEVFKRGLVRELPRLEERENGKRYRIKYSVKSVKRDGVKSRYHKETVGELFSIYIGKKNKFLEKNRSYEYEIVYKVPKQVGFFDTYDEIYWNAVGNGWRVPIDFARVTVQLPNGTSEIQSACYTGEQGSTEKNCSIQRKGDLVLFESSAIGVGKGLTISTGFTPGIVVKPPPPKPPTFFQKFALEILSGIYTLMLLFYYITTWRKHGVDHQKPTVYPQFSAPDNLSPASIGMIKSEGYRNSLLTASIVNLAVKGYLKINEIEKKGFQKYFFGKVYELAKLKETTDGLPPEEKIIMQKLFKSSSVKRIDGKQDKEMISLVKSYKRSLSGKWSNFLMKGKNIDFLAFPTVIGIVSFILFIILHPLFKHSTTFSFFLFGVFVVFNLITFFIYQRLIQKLPVERLRLDSEIEGLQLYLGKAEEKLLQQFNPPKMTPDVFEEFLPYAIALKMDKIWGEKFQQVIETSGLVNEYKTSWTNYSGRDFGRFSNTMNSSLSSSLSSSSTTSSSGSSGSSGGGFSGGGGGGGGGGGW